MDSNSTSFLGPLLLHPWGVTLDPGTSTSHSRTSLTKRLGLLHLTASTDGVWVRVLWQLPPAIPSWGSAGTLPSHSLDGTVFLRPTAEISHPLRVCSVQANVMGAPGSCISERPIRVRFGALLCVFQDAVPGTRMPNVGYICSARFCEVEKSQHQSSEKFSVVVVSH